MSQQRFDGQVLQVAGGDVTNVYLIVVNFTGTAPMSDPDDQTKKIITEVAKSIVDSIRFVMPEPNWEVIELGKAASAAKRMGQWDEAIACLEKLRDVHNQHTTRLPLYLCEAGHWDEGMREFEALLASAGERTRFWQPGVAFPAATAEFRRHCELAAVYDKMRVACKRAKLLPEAARYQQLAAEHAAERDRRYVLLELESQRDLAERRDNREAWIARVTRRNTDGG